MTCEVLNTDFTNIRYTKLSTLQNDKLIVMCK